MSSSPIGVDIGEQLFLSEATVKTHISHVLAKLGVRDRVQAVIAAFTAGIVEPDVERFSSGTTPRRTDDGRPGDRTP